MRHRSRQAGDPVKNDGPQGLAVLPGFHEHRTPGIFHPTMNRDGFAASGRIHLSHRLSRLVPS
jgi:hypothetical protein